MPQRRRHPGSIDRPGRAFRVRLMVGGTLHTFMVDTDDRREVEAFAWRKMAELLSARPSSPADAAPMDSKLLLRFEASKLPEMAPGAAAAYRDSLKPIRTYFCTVLADPRVVDVRKVQVAEFLAWRRVHPLRGTAALSNRTLQKDRAVLHRIFRLAQDLEWREGNPVSLIEPPKADDREPVLLSPAEYARLLTACGDHPVLRLYLLVLGEAGLRCKSEALWLRWEDLNLEEGILTVRSRRTGHRTKSGRSRRVPLSAPLLSALRAHSARVRMATYFDERSPWVFHHERSRRNALAGARIGRLDVNVRKAAQAARIDPAWVQHDLRHRRATLWIAEGKPLPAVQKAMGHSDIKVTMRYVHLVDEHLELLIPRAQRMGKRA